MRHISFWPLTINKYFVFDYNISVNPHENKSINCFSKICQLKDREKGNLDWIWIARKSLFLLFSHNATLPYDYHVCLKEVILTSGLQPGVRVTPWIIEIILSIFENILKRTKNWKKKICFMKNTKQSEWDFWLAKIDQDIRTLDLALPT
jgi:hypothetical protein